jgi:hypothetical protein
MDARQKLSGMTKIPRLQATGSSFLYFDVLNQLPILFEKVDVKFIEISERF